MSTIDGREFARTRAERLGSLADDDAPRLVELGWHIERADYTLRGGVDEDGRDALVVSVDGRLRGVCQRCMEPLELDVRFGRSLRLADSMQEIETAEDDVDRVLASRAMSVETLIEDELVLELPMVARHTDCEPIESNAVAGSAGARPRGLVIALQEWTRNRRGNSGKEQ